jgi:SHS2 domain-containing protein
MPRIFFDHTGDVGVKLSAPTLHALFREAAAAFTETITDIAAVRASSSDDVSLGAPTLDDLLVEWLNELLYRFEVRNLLPADATVSVTETDNGCSLTGRILSESFDPLRHPVKVLIKGVTYHLMNVRRSESGGWETSVVFDI